MADDDGEKTLIGISFPDQFRAQQFFSGVLRLASRNEVQLADAVFVRCDENGSTNVVETTDPTPGRTALSGAMWAGLVGLFVGGPVGWLVGTGVGAGGGAIAAKAIDHGIPDEWVLWFKNEVQPGRTILAILLNEFDRNALIAEVDRFDGAELVYANLAEHWQERIREVLSDGV